MLAQNFLLLIEGKPTTLLGHEPPGNLPLPGGWNRLAHKAAGGGGRYWGSFAQSR